MKVPELKISTLQCRKVKGRVLGLEETVRSQMYDRGGVTVQCFESVTCAVKPGERNGMDAAYFASERNLSDLSFRSTEVAPLKQFGRLVRVQTYLISTVCRWRVRSFSVV